MLSHRGNVRTSKFWRKLKEKKQIFIRKFSKGISGFDLGKKKFKIISCLCTFKSSTQSSINSMFTQIRTKENKKIRIVSAIDVKLADNFTGTKVCSYMRIYRKCKCNTIEVKNVYLHYSANT
jgi:hypothetical protein